MKFAVGYQLRENYEESFISIIRRYKDSISEVYFPWLDTPSGRGSLANNDGYMDWSVQNRLVSDLKTLKALSIKLDLLLNGNCHGKDSVKNSLLHNVSSIVDYLESEGCGIDIVTTASPAIAYHFKKSYPNIEVRASVNMKIGTIKGMQYLGGLFDSFYIQRDFNRNFDKIKELKTWTDSNNKGLYLLVNSGCMKDCSYQTFHDNMVAHGTLPDSDSVIPKFPLYACWNYLKDQENWVSVLQNTWIRPDDLHNYGPYFPVVKLATRTHALPAMVVDAYVRGRYFGNLLDLFEPGYGPAFAPYVIDNSRFPADWFEKTSQCSKNCYDCSYCKDVLYSVLVNSDR